MTGEMVIIMKFIGNIYNMSIFKINLKPVVKDRDWEAKIVSAGRNDYNCCICGAVIKTGNPAVSFTKRTSVGLKTKFQTFRTCYVRHGIFSECTVKKAKELNINLKDLW